MPRPRTAGRPRAASTSSRRRVGGFLCDVRIATGRPHQIRIHLAAAGHPLVGDPLYASGGVPEAATSAVPGDPGYLLHAAEARLRHPRSGDQLVLTCAPPPELRRVSATLPDVKTALFVPCLTGAVFARDADAQRRLLTLSGFPGSVDARGLLLRAAGGDGRRRRQAQRRWDGPSPRARPRTTPSSSRARRAAPT
jgi:hypothetical protein